MLLLVKESIMELSTFLNSQGWQSDEEFGVELDYKGRKTFASETQYRQNNASVYLAMLSDAKEILLVSTDHGVGGAAKWFPVDVTNLDLAAVLGTGIEKCER